MRVLIAILVLVLIGLQAGLWYGAGSVPELIDIHESIDRAEREVDSLAERNGRLEAEVSDLKDGLAAVEERARSELGMVGKDETFFQVID